MGAGVGRGNRGDQGGGIDPENENENATEK